MTAFATGRGNPKRAILAGLAMLAAPGALHAQTSPVPDQPQPRTGPEAGSPRLPAYPKPRGPAALALPAPSGAEPPAGVGPGAVSDVRILTEGDGGSAMPPAGWRPVTDAVSDLRLEHEAGQRLDAAWVRRQFQLNNLVGTGAGVDRALALVQLINQAFLSAGFVNSGLVVAQQASPEILELRLIHGRLVTTGEGGSPVVVEWGGGASKGLGRSYVRDRMPASQGRPISAIDLERDFRLLAEDPAIRTVSADLRPGSRPGEASLHLIVHPQDRVDVYAGYANNRSPSVGGERLFAGGSIRNVLASGDLLSAEAGRTAGLDDVTASYVTPIFTPRTSFSIRGSLNNAAVTDRPLVPLDIQSRDRSGEIGITHRFIEVPLVPSATAGRWLSARALSAGLLLAHRRSKTFLLGEPFSFSPGSVDGRSEYTALRVLGDYLSRNVDQVFAVSVTATLGLDGTRSDVIGIPNPKRHFKAVLAQINYARRLTASGLELRGRVAGQLSDGFLYSGERFSVGGESSVRGYRENLILADEGLIGSVEMTQPFSLTGARRAGRGIDWGAFAISAFAEGATVRNAGPPQPGTRSIYSVGGSLAWAPSDALFAKLSYGHALKDIAQSGTRDMQDRGFHFRVTVRPLRLFGLQ